MLKARRDGTKVITGEVRLSYPALFEPKAMDAESKPKYGAVLLIPKEDTEQVEIIKAAVEEAKQNGITKLFGGKWPKGALVQWHDGDEESDDDTKAGHYFINCYSTTAPQVVDRRKQPITDPLAVYAGCYVRASINFYAYPGGKKGVACGLNNVQFVRDGEPLAGKTSAQNDFDELEDDNSYLEDVVADFMD